MQQQWNHLDTGTNSPLLNRLSDINSPEAAAARPISQELKNPA
jgi:hypothetical protein